MVTCSKVPSGDVVIIRERLTKTSLVFVELSALVRGKQSQVLLKKANNMRIISNPLSIHCPSFCSTSSVGLNKQSLQHSYRSPVLILCGICCRYFVLHTDTHICVCVQVKYSLTRSSTMGELRGWKVGAGWREEPQRAAFLRNNSERPQLHPGSLPNICHWSWIIILGVQYNLWPMQWGNMTICKI